MTNTNWRSLVAVPMIAFGCCSLASANVAAPSLALTTLGQRAVSEPATTPNAAREQQVALSCYATLEGYLKCIQESPPPPPPKRKT